MALIQCPECGREISDRVKACPHCGFPLQEKNDQPAEPAVQAEPPFLQPDSPFPLEKEFPPPESAPFPQEISPAGTSMVPVESLALPFTPIAPTKKKINKKILLVSLLAFVVVALIATAAGIGIHNANVARAKAEAEQQALVAYRYDIIGVKASMSMGIEKATEISDLTKTVWYNAIYEKSDYETDKYTKVTGSGKTFWSFSIAIYNMFADHEIEKTVEEITKNQTQALSNLRKVQNPPKGFEKCYDTINELYAKYKSLTDLALEPTGTYRQYSDNVMNLLNEIHMLSSQFEAQLPALETSVNSKVI